MNEEVAMGVLGNESGVSKLKVLLIIAVLVLGFMQGIKYLSVRLDYERMKDTMESKASVAQVLKDEEILRDLEIRARELGLPMKPEDFLLDRDADQGIMTIRTAWNVQVRYLWGLCGEPCEQTYHFEPVVRESYRK
jgi:hypothetical protein